MTGKPARDPGYTHLIVYEKRTHYGWIELSFRTTADAVPIYLKGTNPMIRNVRAMPL